MACIGDRRTDVNRVEHTRYWNASPRTIRLAQRFVSILDHREIHLSSAQICMGRLDWAMKTTIAYE